MFDEGLFVTNQHVIEGATYLVVEDDDGDWYILDSVVVSDAEHDIAILLFPESSAYPSLEYDPSFDKLMRGQSVLAIGSPEGLSGTVSDGIISAFPLSESRDTRYIQITAPISHGSSGGCLLNDRLKVIGVTSAGYEEGENLGFAIPVFIVEQLYMQWNKKDSVTLGSETSWDTVGHGLHNKISGAIEKPQVQTGDSGNGHASPEPDTPAQPAAESSGGTTAGTGNEKAAVPEVWVCKGCQTENEQTKQYCTKCGNPWKSPLGTEQVGEILVTAGKNGSRKILRSEPDPDSNQVTVVYPGNRYPCYAVRLGSTRKPWYYVWVKEDYAWGWISSGFATLSE